MHMEMCTGNGHLLNWWAQRAINNGDGRVMYGKTEKTNASQVLTDINKQGLLCWVLMIQGRVRDSFALKELKA